MSTGAERRPTFLSAVTTTFGTYLAAASLSLVNLFIVARALGPSGRGDTAFLIIVAVVAAHLGALSVQEANANLAGSEPASRPRLATNSLLLSLLCGVASAVVVVGLVTVFPAVGGEVERTLLWVALASIPLVILRVYLNYLVQADYTFGVTNVAWLLGPTTTVAVNGLLAAFGALSVAGALAAWIGGQGVGTLILLRHVWRNAGFGRPDLRLAARSLAFGAKAHIGRTMTVANYRIDQWFVGSIKGSRELGLYSVATAWAEVLSYLPGVLVLVQRPDLVRASREAAGVRAARVFRVALLLTAFLAAAFVVAAPLLCVTLLGREFEGSVDDLRVLTLASFGVVALELLGSALTAQRRPLLTTGAMSATLAAAILLNVLLVPAYGGLGAAVAAAISATLGGVVMTAVFAQTLGARLADLTPRARDVPWLVRELRVRFGSRR